MALELISIHIPKTGGTSFQSALWEIYGHEAVLSGKRKDIIEDPGFFRSMIEPQTKVIHGHFTYKEILPIVNEFNVPVVTWLREPVRRVISNHNFFQKRLREGKAHNLERINEPLLKYARLAGSRNRMKTFLDGIDLKDMHFVGIMEYYNEDLEYLSQQLNWKKTPIFHRNHNPSAKVEPSTRELRKIRKLNREDCNLYDYALALRANRNKL